MSDQDIEIEEAFAQKKLSRNTLQRLGHFMKPYFKPLFFTLALEVIWVLLLVSGPYFIGLAIDVYLVPGTFDGLWKVAVIYLIAVGLQTFIGINQFRMMCYFGFNFLNDLRIGLFNHIQTLSIRYFDKTKEGRIIARVDNDVDSLEHAFVWGPLILVHCVFMIISTSIVMFSYNYKLWLMILLIGSLLFVFTRIFSREGRKAHRRIRESYSQFVANFAESVAGARIIKAFNAEERTHTQFNAKVIKNKFDFIKGAYVWSLYFPSINLMFGLSTAVIIVYGGSMVLTGELMIGELSAFTLLIGMFFWPLEALGDLYNNVLSASAAAERIFLLLDTKPEIIDAENAIEMPQIKGDIKFDNVTFAYEPENEKHWGMEDMSFEIEAGKILAIVGETGSGKSSIINLVTRFYEPLKGKILIDDNDISEVKIKSLHQQMGIVLQENFLFSGTVMDNLKFGNPDVTDETVFEAAKELHSHDVILNLAKGYDTEVNERGAGLSQGERQLICFTRAYIADPAILILDEATSSVDTKTEGIIQKALENLTKNRTTIIVAHRLSTIKNADLILVVDQGEIIERGNHKTLLRNGSAYHKMYQKYLRAIPEITE